jgi:hypothetical protein
MKLQHFSYALSISFVLFFIGTCLLIVYEHDENPIINVIIISISLFLNFIINFSIGVCYLYIKFNQPRKIRAE